MSWKSFAERVFTGEELHYSPMRLRGLNYCHRWRALLQPTS